MIKAKNMESGKWFIGKLTLDQIQILNKSTIKLTSIKYAKSNFFNVKLECKGKKKIQIINCFFLFHNRDA